MTRVASGLSKTSTTSIDGSTSTTSPSPESKSSKIPTATEPSTKRNSLPTNSPSLPESWLASVVFLSDLHRTSHSSRTPTPTTSPTALPSTCSTAGESTIDTKLSTHLSGDLTAGSTDATASSPPPSSEKSEFPIPNVNSSTVESGATIPSNRNSKSSPTASPTHGALISTTEVRPLPLAASSLTSSTSSRVETYHKQSKPHLNPYVYDYITTIRDHHHKSAHGGARFYLGDAFPPKYRDQLFMCNIHQHQVLTDVMHPKRFLIHRPHTETTLSPPMTWPGLGSPSRPAPKAAFTFLTGMTPTSAETPSTFLTADASTASPQRDSNPLLNRTSRRSPTLDLSNSSNTTTTGSSAWLAFNYRCVTPQKNSANQPPPTPC